MNIERNLAPALISASEKNKKEEEFLVGLKTGKVAFQRFLLPLKRNNFIFHSFHNGIFHAYA